MCADAYVMDESTTLPDVGDANSIFDENAMTIKIQTTKKCSKYKVKEVCFKISFQNFILSACRKLYTNNLNVFVYELMFYRARNLKESC